jgi:hypothetical protein
MSLNEYCKEYLNVQLHVERMNVDIHLNLLLLSGKVKVKFAIRQIDNTSYDLYR